MHFFRVNDLPEVEVLPGVRLRSVGLADLMMTFVDYDAGAEVPTHRHSREEQITSVLEGFLEVTIGGERRVLGPGEGVRIPRGVEHGSRPVEGPARAVDAWTPIPSRFRAALTGETGPTS